MGQQICTLYSSPEYLHLSIYLNFLVFVIMLVFDFVLLFIEFLFVFCFYFYFGFSLAFPIIMICFAVNSVIVRIAFDLWFLMHFNYTQRILHADQTPAISTIFMHCSYVASRLIYVLSIKKWIDPKFKRRIAIKIHEYHPFRCIYSN